MYKRQKITSGLQLNGGYMREEKLVYVRHANAGLFLFAVPDDLNLKAGDEVVCDTKFGQAEGRCACDSFVTNEGRFVRQAAGVCESTVLKTVLRLKATPEEEAAIPGVFISIDEFF